MGPGLEPHEVEDEASLSVWAWIVTTGFGLPALAEEPMRAMTDAVLRAASPAFRAFVVRRRGRAVAAAPLYRRLGFRIRGRIGAYVWAPPA